MTNVINSSEQMIEKVILDGNGWYDSEHMELVYTYYKKLVDIRGMLKKAVTGVERIKLNKEIKKVIQDLNDSNAL